MTVCSGEPVRLVGAGPGDPDLLTLRAEQYLAVAELIVADAVLADLVATTSPGAELTLVPEAVDPTGVERAVERLAVASHAGRRALRLYLGDPWTHPTYHGERRALARRGFAVEDVPGLVPELALAAGAGLAATARPIASVVRIGPAAALAAPRPGVNDLWLADGGLRGRVAGVGVGPS